MCRAPREVVTHSTAIRGLAAAGGLVVMLVLLRLVNRSIDRCVQDPDARYRARKPAKLVGWVVLLLFVAALLSDRLTQLGVSLGVASARASHLRCRAERGRPGAAGASVPRGEMAGVLKHVATERRRCLKTAAERFLTHLAGG